MTTRNLSTILWLGAVLLTGCSANSRIIAEPASEPLPLALVGEENGLLIRIDGLVVPNGAGSWIRDAGWDEYQITLENRSDQPLELRGFALQDPAEEWRSAGTDPKELEDESKQLNRLYKDIGISVAIGALPFATVAMAGGSAVVLTSSVALTAFVLTPAFLVAGGTYLVSSRQVEGRDQRYATWEIETRSIPVSLELDPGEQISGSLFFPIVPSPNALVVQYTRDGEPRSARLELNALAGLHIDPDAAQYEPSDTVAGR
jgi:hypothetical protein